MSAPANVPRFLYWAPRLLTMVFAALLALFAMDVLGEVQGLSRTAQAFTIHLVPCLVVLAILAVAWRRDWVGAVAYAGLAVWYLVTSWGRFHWSAYAGVSGPLFVMAALFLASWIARKRLPSQAR